MLNKPISHGCFLDLEHSFLGSALIGSAGLWLLLSAAARFLLDQPISTAISIGFSAMILHWMGEVWHQLGHARAARRLAAPMQGVRYWWILGFSVYPPEEPELSAGVHLRRAWGGPTASLALALFLGLLLLLIRPAGPTRILMAFFFLDNLLVYSLGALLPLGFTDGSTLMRYWGEK